MAVQPRVAEVPALADSSISPESELEDPPQYQQKHSTQPARARKQAAAGKGTARAAHCSPLPPDSKHSAPEPTPGKGKVAQRKARAA